MAKPVLVFGYGNPSRGDDAVGPLLIEYLQQRVDNERVELLTDFQLQIEHALDLENRDLVIFVDASVAADRAFTFVRLAPCFDNSYTSHAMSPAALLHVYENVSKISAPPSFLLAIGAGAFELGEGVSECAAQNLRKACRYIEALLSLPIERILAARE